MAKCYFALFFVYSTDYTVYTLEIASHLSEDKMEISKSDKQVPETHLKKTFSLRHDAKRAYVVTVFAPLLKTHLIH